MDYGGLGMYREWNKIEWKQQDWEVDQEIYGKMKWGEWNNSGWRRVEGKDV
jgi:hypothetical protein